MSLPPLLPQEHRTEDVAEVFRSASSTLPASVRLSSDQPLVGLQWRFTESDLAALPGLQTAREWQIPPAKRLTGSVTASLWLFNPGDENTAASIEDASHGTALTVSLRPGELREVAATGWLHESIRVLSDNPVAAYMLYRSATGCGWATASAGPGLALPMQPIDIEVSADGSRLVAWPSAAVTDETLSFRHPVDQVSVSASCGLGGVCAGNDFDRHTAVDYGTGSATPPAFASNFGTLRRTIDFNQGTGCNKYPLSCNMGNSVVIEYLQTNGEKWLSLDSHLTSKTVSGSGGRIAKGQQIGVVGCSGDTFCFWCTNHSCSLDNKHAHHEHKLPELGTLDLWPYGYMDSSEANQLKRPEESSISIAEALSRAFTTVDALRSRGIRVLVPFFSPSSSSPGPGNYEVYGIAGAPLNATLTMTPTTARTFTNIGVGGRVWNNDSINMDLFTSPSESIGANETRTLSGARTFASGDYNFYAYIERHQERPLGRGYSVKLAVLPNASSIVIDNDGRSGYVASEAGAQTVPGYFLSASLFQGGSGNWAQWRPGRAGLFEIWAHVPTGATASQVAYKVYTDGTHFILSSPVSQASTNDQWVKLTSNSTQSWNLSSTGYVGLSVESIPGAEKVGADAIKFIYLGTGNGVPTAPSNLSATTDSTFRAILFWSDNSSNETVFKVERKLGAAGSWSQIATLGAGSTGYTDTGLSPSTTYVYRVRATNSLGDSAYSNEASITTVAASCSSSTSTITSGQSLAGNLLSTDCFNSVRTSSYYNRFAFSATGGVSYTITMTSSTFDTYLVLKNASGTVVATNDDADGTNSRILYTPTTSGTYVIEATSYASRATGAYTVSLFGSGGNSTPAAPSNLSATTDSTFRAILLWNDNSSNETGFKIERKLGTVGSWSQIATLGAGSTGYADTGLSPSTTYVYRVRATNGFGDSAYSNEASITTVAASCSSSTSTIISGRSLAGNLSSTDCYNSVRTSSYYDRFAFIATGGVSYTITMTSSIFDTYLVLKNASGTVVATNDDADGTNSRIIYTPTAAGTYVIEATSYASRATGAYTVSLSSR